MDTNEVLRRQVMLSQFVNAVGCSTEEATQILTSARWQLEAALSLFFQGHSAGSPTRSNSQSTPHQTTSTPSTNPGSSAGSSLGSRMSYQTCVPTNTPATPPQFPDTLAAFAQMQTSSPADNSSTTLLQETTIVHCQTQASKS